MPAFDCFVIFADMRTGSNFLETALNSVEGVTCHGEAYNPAFVGYPKRTDLLGFDRARREAAPLDLWSAIRRAPGLNGFRFFHDHDPRMIEPLLADRRCAKIILTRNPVESYVSLKIARTTGQWKLGDARHRKSAVAEFDTAEFEAHLAASQDFQLRLLRGLQISGQTAFYIDHDDLSDLPVLNGLLAFLGIRQRLAALPEGIVRQNPEAIAEKVTNFAAMEASLARIDRFNLSRTPNFEPRRGPNIPSFVAAAGAGLLFQPIRSAPDGAITRWLAEIGEAGLHPAFDQKSLRQWKRGHPGHRSFTVLRHPLARAHHAFVTTILSGKYAEIRETLRRLWKLPLPAKVAEPLSPEQHAAAFAGFLRFLKANLSGQTSIRVDPTWASQTAVIQGFAQFTLPDRILREEDLPVELNQLAQDTGVSAPQYQPDPPDETLAQIHSPALEALCREAYGRDYLGFGFSDWRSDCGADQG